MAKFLRLDDVVQPTAVLFGARLKKRREELKLTQGHLFEQTGITAAYISMIERAQANPTLDMMIKLADAVGLQAWDMLRPDPETTGKE